MVLRLVRRFCNQYAPALRSASHAAHCTARHGAVAMRYPAGANIASPVNAARHSLPRHTSATAVRLGGTCQPRSARCRSRRRASGGRGAARGCQHSPAQRRARRVGGGDGRRHDRKPIATCAMSSSASCCGRHALDAWLRIERLTRLAVAARLQHRDEDADRALTAVLAQRRRVESAPWIN